MSVVSSAGRTSPPRVERLPPASASALALTLLTGSVLLGADAQGALRIGWGLVSALVCCSGAIALLSVPHQTPAMYVGVLARLSGNRALLVSLRAAVIATAPIAGVGPVAYALLALAQALTEEERGQPRLDWQRALGTGLLGLSFVLAAEQLGFALGGDILWLILVTASGLSAFWWLSGPSRTVRRSAAGLALLSLLPYSFFLVGFGIDEVVLGALGGALAVTLVVAPRWLRHSRSQAAERARLARAEERAEVAETVHDSVLQTLALIQSRADSPAEVRALARTQERELRDRLFAQHDHADVPDSIATALRRVAGDVEELHRVRIEVVTVGDGPMDPAADALVSSAREALVNAARHASDGPIALFAEIDERRVCAYVRDRGPGFDPEAIPPDRRGVTDSIVARMVRHGGHAAVRTAPGGGSEVRIVLERRG
jgi:signal transduction histidine kinase